MPHKYFSDDDKKKFLKMLVEGKPFEEIMEAIGLSERTCRRWKAKLLETGSLDCEPIPGRPLAISDRGIRAIARVAEKSSYMTAAEIVESADINAGPSTSRKYLKLAGKEYRYPLQKHFLDTEKAKTRFRFTRAHLQRLQFLEKLSLF